MATQTGSIDLTASNGVKLMAEAGFTNAERTYATKSALDVQADRISMVVENSEASGDLTLTADALEYIGDHVEIKGTDGTSTVISGGQIQTGSLSIGAFDSAAQSATLNSNISVGGRNWLLDTGTFNDWVSGTGITFSNGVATFPSRSSLWWASIRHFTIPAADFFGNTWTFSFDYRSDDFSDTSGNRYIQVNLEASASYNASDRTKYRALNSSSISGAANTWVPTTEWQRGSVTFTAADESFLSGGSGDVNYVGITIWSYTLNSFQVRRMKLEKGNKPTDWSPAPEDVDSAIETVPQYKVRTTTYSYTLSRWLTYAAEGAQDSWSQVSDVKVGDTVLLKGTNRDTGDAVYMLMTVDELTSSGRVNKATSHGLVDPTAGQRADNAAKTATSYVTEITGQNGIMVHPSTDDDTGVRITSDVDILRNGYNVINVGTQGDTSGNTDAGVTIYDGTTNENVVATFDGDGIGLVGGAFRLTSERVTEEYGDENNPTTMTEIRSIMKSEGGNDDFETRCFLRSMVGDDADAYYNSIELTSETDIKTQSPTETNNASVEVGSDQWGSSVRLVADSQELHLYKHPVDGKDYFNLNSEVFMITDYHNGVNVWSTAPGTVLWSSGGWHMAANHTANLAYNVSTCPTGILLHFQPYTSSTTQNYNHIYYFVPKEHVASYNGTGVVVQLGNPNFSNMASKYLYISNDHITGHANNTATGTGSGITYNNGTWVMTQVIAV